MAKTPAELAHGPMFIGYVFNLALYGIMIIQVYIYHTTYSRRDRLWIKIFVAALFLGDTLNAVFDFVYLYDCLIKQFGNVHALERVTWLFGTHAPLTSIIACMVQLFYAWRIRVLTKNLYLVVIVILFAITGLTAGIITSVDVMVKLLFFARFQESKIVVVIWLGADSICDVLITSSLVWYFLALTAPCNLTIRRKHKTGFKKSDMVIDRIIRMTMQTGLLTSVVALVDLVVFLADPTGTHLIFNFALCKLYSNSLMSSLNARRTKLDLNENEGSHAQSFDVSVGNIPTNPHRKFSNTHRKPTHSTPKVFVHVETHELHEVSSTSSYQDFGAPASSKSRSTVMDPGNHA